MSQSLQGDATAFSSVVATRPRRDAVYRAVWRWHFYAGLLCLPFLILLSVTGSLRGRARNKSFRQHVKLDLSDVHQVELRLINSMPRHTRRGTAFPASRASRCWAT